MTHLFKNAFHAMKSSCHCHDTQHSTWRNTAFHMEENPRCIESLSHLFCLVDPCYPKGCAAPGFVPCQCNTRGPLSKLERTPPQRKINVTSKSPVGDISVVTLIRTDTTLDHSQKAEKVCMCVCGDAAPANPLCRHCV